MPHRHDHNKTDLNDAVKILSGIRERVQRLEQSRRGGSSEVQLSRTVDDHVGCVDTVTVTEGTASGFVFGTSEWGFDEFGQTR